MIKSSKITGKKVLLGLSGSAAPSRLIRKYINPPSMPRPKNSVNRDNRRAMGTGKAKSNWDRMMIVSGIKKPKNTKRWAQPALRFCRILSWLKRYWMRPSGSRESFCGRPDFTTAQRFLKPAAMMTMAMAMSSRSKAVSTSFSSLAYL